MHESINTTRGKFFLTNLSQLRNDIRQYAGPDTVINVMSIDLEEWFQVTNFENVISRSGWNQCLSRTQEVMPRLLDLFSEHRVRATFFTLGWIAERYPELIRRISKEGHEIASHGYDHRLVTTMTRDEFRQQLIQSKDILEQILGEAIYGYRAPTYSFRKETHWVIEELLDTGFLFDSSIFPHGKRDNPELCDSKFPCYLSGKGKQLAEYPLSIFNFYGMEIPIAGGGYFRLLPYMFVKQMIERLNQKDKLAIMYFHPWEFDPEQPKVASAPMLSKFRHYVNLKQNEDKLKCLVRDFRFASFKDIFWDENKRKYNISTQI